MVSKTKEETEPLMLRNNNTWQIYILSKLLSSNRSLLWKKVTFTNPLQLKKQTNFQDSDSYCSEGTG